MAKRDLIVYGPRVSVETETYLLAEIAGRLRRAFSLPDSAGVTQSLRYWVNHGLVRPVGPIHTGRGRDRLFEPQEILRAALVFEMAKWNVTVGTMKHLFSLVDLEVGSLGGGNLIKLLALTDQEYFRFIIWGYPPKYVLSSPQRPFPAPARSSLYIDARKLKRDLGL